MNIQEKIEYIADYYGWESQSRQLIEEMAELTVALNKLWRKHEYRETDKEKEKACKAVVEELADVTIMTKQLIYLLGSEDEIDKIARTKLNRQIRRIWKENSAKED